MSSTPAALTVEEIGRLVEGRVIPADASALAHPITGAAAIAEAGPQEVTFLGNPKYLPLLKKTGAACVLVPEGFTQTAHEGVKATLIEVANPSVAFSRILERFVPEEEPVLPGIHPNASVATSAKIGEGVHLGANVVVGEKAHIGDGTIVHSNTVVGAGSRIGSHCVIHANVSIRERSQIGDRVTIHSGTVIGSDGFGYELVEGRHVKIPQTGIVQIDNDVEIGANTTIDRARFGRTWIGEGTKIDNLVQIAHNVVIGKHCIIVSQVGISGSSRIGDYATLAGQVGVVGHIEIGSRAVVAAKSGVSKSIPPKEVWWGSPAAPIRESKERVAIANRLPKLLERVRKLEQQIESLQRHR